MRDPKHDVRFREGAIFAAKRKRTEFFLLRALREKRRGVCRILRVNDLLTTWK